MISRKADRVWTASVSAAAALLFVSTLSGAVSAGDAPESVAGVKVFGVLHAPGYPAYVLLAKLFTVVAPFAGLALRVNLFSLVCAVVAVAATFRVALRLGTGREAAALGALVLASGTSFWFYAGFAKYYALSAALLVLAALFVLGWQDQGARWRLAVAGVCLGLCLGASWQLASMSAVTLSLLVLTGRRRPSAADLVVAVATASAVALALFGLLMVRAAADPEINWGRATNVQRMADLVTLKDFGFGSKAVGGGGGIDRHSVNSKDAAALPRRLAAYGVVMTREIGVVGVLLALWGLVVSLWSRTLPRARAAYLAAAFALNLVGAALVVGYVRAEGFVTSLAQGGFLSGVFIVLAFWASLAADDVMHRVQSASARRQGNARSRPAVAVAVVLGVVLLVPSIAVHRRHANHGGDGLVDAFARTVFAALPQNAVLFSWGAERSFPLQYRQTVFGDRRDVALINADQLTLPWYREEASRRLGLRLSRTPGSADDATEAALIAARLRPRRPVYLEGAAMPSMIKAIGYKPSGIVAEVVDGPGVKPPDSLTDLEHLVTAQQQRAGIVGGREQRRFPNEIVVQSFVVAELEVATAFYNAHDYAGAERHLLAALRLDPDNRRIPGQLDQVRNQPRTR